MAQTDREWTVDRWKSIFPSAVYVPLSAAKKPTREGKDWNLPTYEGAPLAPNGRLAMVTWRAGIVVLDCDNAATEARVREVIGGVRTLEVKASRGAHLYFRATPGSPTSDILTHDDDKLEGFQLDVKAWGYVICPPTPGRTWNGVRELAPFDPSWLLALPEIGARQHEALPEDDEQIPPGSQADTLYRLACRDRGLGYSWESIADLTWGRIRRQCVDQDSSNPWTTADARAIAESAARFEPNISIELDLETPEEPGAKIDAEEFTDGGSFIFDEPPGCPAVWGDGDQVLWAEGEATILCGPPGVGKTTISGQLIWARLGLLDGVLGMTVAPTKSKVLYLAADRPRQAARALGRLADPADRQVLEERLVVKKGPPLVSVLSDPSYLCHLAESVGADTLIIDSLKDVATKLSDDDTGSHVNKALQICVAAGIEVLVLHHQRKAGAENTKPKKLSDVYGSAWITAGVGSVILLWGEAGDVEVELRHLKQPLEVVGPWTLIHDHAAGTTERQLREDQIALATLRTADGPLSIKHIAQSVFGAVNPTTTDATRLLMKKLEQRGAAERAGQTTGPGRPADLWVLAEVELEIE